MRTPCSSSGSRFAAPAACLLAIALALAGCGGDGGAAAAGEPSPQQGGVLRYPLATRPQHLTPPLASTRDELMVVRALFSGLVDVDPETGGLVPVIARSWHASDGLRSFSFRLRTDVRFSNGAPVSAGTFVDDWSFVCRVNGPAAPLLAVIQGGEGCGEAGWVGPLTGVSAPAPDRLEVRLRTPFADFPAVLANPGLWAFPAAIAQDELAGAGSTVVGSGPFVLGGSPTDSPLVLERNPAALHPAHVDSVELTPLPGGDAQRAAMAGFRQGIYDLAEVPVQQAQVTMADPELSRRLLVQPIAAVTLVALRPSPRLGLDQRRALAWATDAHTVAASVTGGVSVVADGLVPPVMASYAPGESPYTYDKSMARRTLAGRPLVGVTASAVPDAVLPGLADTRRVMAALIAGYRRAGLPVEEARAGTGSAVVVRLDAAYPAADAILSQVVPRGDDRSLAPARGTADPGQRADRYRQLAARLLDAATVIPVTFDARAFVVSPRVSHFQIDSLGLPHLETCWLTGPTPAGS